MEAANTQSNPTEDAESHKCEVLITAEGRGTGRSWVHQFFSKDANNLVYSCNICNKTLKARTDGSTGNLHNHLKFVHKKTRCETSEGAQNKRQKTFETGGQEHNFSSDIRTEGLTSDTFKKALNRFVVDTNQPFSIVEAPSFQRLVTLISKDLVATKIPGRTSMTANILQEYNDYKQILVQDLVKLNSKVSLVIDCWTSSNEIAFQGVIARFITDQWVLRTIPLDLTALSGPHSGENIAHALFQVVEEFGIIDKVGAITTDNASNMDTFFDSFATLMESKGKTFDIRNQRVRCLAHIINLCAKDAIKCFEKGEAGSILEKLRKGINAIRSSPQRREIYRNQCESLKLKFLLPIADVQTRWNSTYDMIERAIIIKPGFQATLQTKEELRHYLLSEKDWCYLTELMKFLKPIKEATTMISKETVPNVSSTTVIYQYLFTHFDRSKLKPSPSWMVEMAKAAHKKLEKYYPDSDGKSYVFGTGFKLQWYRQANWPEKWVQTYNNLVVEEWEQKYKVAAASGGDSEPSGSEEGDFFSMLYKQQMGAAAKSPADELAKYLAESIVPSEQLRTTGLLGWWKIHEAEYPYLSKMALDYLSVAGSGVPVEALFSRATDILTDNRQSLTSENIKALLCLKAWHSMT